MSELIKRKDAIKATWQEPSYTDPINVLTEVRDRINAIPAASPWHRVEEPPKEEGKYFVAYRSSVVDGWGYDTAYYTKHLEDKMLVIPVPENSEGWFNWSDFSDCDMLVFPDYWMPTEPPKEEEHGN